MSKRPRATCQAATLIIRTLSRRCIGSLRSPAAWKTRSSGRGTGHDDTARLNVGAAPDATRTGPSSPVPSGGASSTAARRNDLQLIGQRQGSTYTRPPYEGRCSTGRPRYGGCVEGRGESALAGPLLVAALLPIPAFPGIQPDRGRLAGRGTDDRNANRGRDTGP